MEGLNEGMNAASEFLKKAPDLIEGLVKSYVDKYGNEPLVRKYVKLIMDGKNKEAEKLVKQLENG